MSFVSRFRFACRGIVGISWTAILVCSSIGSTDLAAAERAAGEIEWLGVVELDGTARDKSGLTDQLDGNVPHDRLGGWSAIESLGEGRYLALSDRGPADGATQYRCRWHELAITIDPNRTPVVQATVTGTTLLTDEQGQSLLGAEKVDPARSGDATRRFDPEGFRRGRDGITWVSDEYGPYLYGFDDTGRRQRTITIPAMFLAPSGQAGSAAGTPATGRQDNRGLEGLALSPDGRRLFALMQGPLHQDGGTDGDDGRTGENVRLLEIDLASGKTRQFVYVLDKPAYGLNEIVAIGGDEFLVIERDGKAGTKAKAKKIYRIDLRQATDVSAVASLPTKGLPSNVRPVAKTVFIDLLDPKFGLAGPNCPAKIEGLTFGPTLPDGRQTFLIATDNDFLDDKPNRIDVFAIPKALVPKLPK